MLSSQRGIDIIEHLVAFGGIGIFLGLVCLASLSNIGNLGTRIEFRGRSHRFADIRQAIGSTDSFIDGPLDFSHAKSVQRIVLDYRALFRRRKPHQHVIG
jgi:cell division protein FtsX